MTLEQHVASSELAEELKNRDVPQDTEFCWVKGPYGLDQVVERTRSRMEYIAAYTHEELFDLLPTYYDIGGVDYYFETEEIPGGYRAYFTDGTHILDGYIMTERTLADAWARGLLYLMDLRIINPEDLHL